MSSLDAVTIGIDMGGTFVDSVAVTAAERTVSAKVPTTPAEPETGIVNALRATAVAAGIELSDLLARTTAIVHGTTLGLNALLSRSGGRVALLATRGHEDAILIGRVHQKVAGLRPHELTRVNELRKPEPLVPRWAIHGIHERVDAAGQVVVPLDEGGVMAAADSAVQAGCDAIAVAFLWSFLRPDHERQAAKVIGECHPNMPVILSSDVAPVIGEYERTAATIISAMLLAPLAGYLDRLGDKLAGLGFTGELLVMGMGGGVIPADMAARRPVETLRSGPIGGIVAARQIVASQSRGERRAAAGRGPSGLITADMGGTSFDVGVLADGEPHLADLTVAGQFHVAVPSIDIQSIGAGGGSIAWLDDIGGLHVGPQSAGSAPGPACYGRGGTMPTVTDADLVLGRLDPDAVLGGEIRLDRDAALWAIGDLAGRVGIDPIVAAAGIVRVADAQMADLIRNATIEHGRDPRMMQLVAFGGAGPLHVGSFGPDVGVAEAIVPASASVLSGLGLAQADYRRSYRRSRRLGFPVDPALVADLLAEMRIEAEAEFAASGMPGRLTASAWVDVRYRRQTHQLRIPLRAIVSTGGDSIARLDPDELTADFEVAYARTFGTGTGFAGAGMEATSVGLVAVATRVRPSRSHGTRAVPTRSGAASEVGAASAGRSRRQRAVWFHRWLETPIVAAADLAAAEVVEGPAIVELWATTLVVHPGQRASIDERGHAHLRFARGSGA